MRIDKCYPYWQHNPNGRNYLRPLLNTDLFLCRPFNRNTYFRRLGATKAGAVISVLLHVEWTN